MSDPAPQDPQPRKRNVTRWVAGLLLVPSVPLLLLSVAALGLFYVAPERFSELLERLPGDQYLRSGLAFAPAVLLAFVVLAILYALERPEPAARPMPVPPERGAAEAGTPARPRPPLRFRISMTALLLTTPPFLASAIAALLAFIAPGRFWGALSDLPGQRYLRAGVPLAPVALLVMLALAGVVAARAAPAGWAGGRQWLTQLAARLPTATSLGVAVLLWLASLGGLLLFQVRPELLERLIERLTARTLFRVQLAFAPVILFAVVLLSGLSLIGGRPSTPDSTQAARSAAAVVVLSVGLLLTALLSLGLAVVVAAVILR